MNEHAPPVNGKGALPAPIPKLLLNSPQNNSGSVIAQHLCGSETIWWRWEIEAGRLFSLFWATANAKHLRAFSAHVQAMRGLAGRRRL
jgi:hypothetical protein